MTYNITLNKGRLQAVNMPEKPIEKPDCPIDDPKCDALLQEYNRAVEKAKSEAIDFRPEDYHIFKSGSIRILCEGQLGVKIEDVKEGETYPKPDGFDVEIVYQIFTNTWTEISRADYHHAKLKYMNDLRQYARLVPIKEQPEICYNCQGRGSLPTPPTNSEVTCKVCNGTGGVSKEQNSAHGYSEGSEFYKPAIQGKRELEDVENISRLKNMLEPSIYTERAIELSDKTQQIGPLNDKKLSLDLRSAPTKEELRKEFYKKMVFFHQGREQVNPDSSFDWFYSKLLTYQQEIAAQKQLTKDEIKRVSDIYQEEIDRLKKELQDERYTGRQEWEKLQLSLVDELWTLWESLAESGQISASKEFLERYKAIKEKANNLQK